MRIRNQYPEQGCRQTTAARFWVPIVVLALFVGLVPQCVVGQESEKSDAGQKLVTVKGRILQHPDKRWKIDLAELQPKLVEFVLDRLPEPELPKDWDKLTNEQRQKWIEEFEKSDEGQKLLAEQERVLQAARQFEVPVEENGEFVVYDVPPATYGLSGRVDKKIGDYNYVFEVFGQLIVGDNVDEVLLDPIAVMVTPIFEAGQPVPEFEVTTLDGKKVTAQSYQGRNVLLDVWSSEYSPPSVEFQKQVQTVLQELKEQGIELEVSSICLDSDPARIRKTVQQNALGGPHAVIPGWDDPLVERLGVRVLPWFMLVDEQGKIRLTHDEIRRQFSTGKSLTEIIAAGIQGKSAEAKSSDGNDSSDGN